MIVKFVAKFPEQVRAFLCEEAGITFVGSIEQSGEVRRWHDDVWDDVTKSQELGEIWPVYSAEIPDRCQDHVTNFEEYKQLGDNYLFVLNRAFCKSCRYIPHVVISKKADETKHGAISTCSNPVDGVRQTS